MNHSANKRRNSGDRITGSMAPFKGSELEKTFHEINIRSINPELLDCFRELMKANTAYIFEDALKSNHHYAKIPDTVIDIVYHELKAANFEQYVASFVECTIRYFNHQKKHSVVLYINGNPYRAKELDKAVAQASAHIKKAEKTYVQAIIKMLKGFQENLPVGKETDYKTMLKKMEAIKDALDYLCYYFSNVCKRKLPQFLGETTYQGALGFDAKLSEYYTRTSYGTYQRRKNANVPLNMFAPECSAYIVTQMYIHRGDGKT